MLYRSTGAALPTQGSVPNLPIDFIVYDAKVSIRSKLHILQIIRSKLSWKVDRLVRNPSPHQPFIFDIDGRSLEFGREDFCLITGFRFGKVSLDPKEEDHFEFCKRVFPKNANLKGEHLLELVKNDVEFNQLDDEDVVRVCLLLIWGLETFSNLIHWWRKYENVSPVVFHGVMGQSLKNQVHQEVHVRTEVRRFVDKQKVRTRVVDEEDVQERVVLAKTVKEQEQMIADLQRRLYSVEKFTKQLHTGPSDVDLLDKNGNHSHNVQVGDNFAVDGPEYQSVKGSASVPVLIMLIRILRVPKCTKKPISMHEGVMSLFCDKKRMDMHWTFPWIEDGHVIRMDFYEKLASRSHTKRGFPAQSVGSSNTDVLDSPCLLVLITGTSQSRQRGKSESDSYYLSD
nr:phospholipase-like protein [Tanacetum cinerariifolium]